MRAVSVVEEVEEIVDLEAEPEPEVAFSTPGEADAARFKLHPSVEKWKYWNFDDSKFPTTPELIAGAAQHIFEATSSTPGATTPTGAAYWAYHSLRSAVFASQGVAAIMFTELQLRLRGEQDAQSAYPLPSNVRARLMCETFETFCQDLDNIQKGVYKLPWDMTTRRHRQFNPLYVLAKGVEFVQEANLTLSRRKAQSPEPIWMKSDLYPEYYLATFHFQTDGWFSSKSASVYETSTETLFLGRQDAMQRQALVPIHSWLKETGQSSAGMQLLEVGCGTGRFHTFIKDNYPLMHTAALDLSPYYLQAARENVAYWKRMASGEQVRGGATFLHAAAESIPMEDASCDVVVNVYMYHEMPREAQEAATKEMARVLKPGGLMVLCDSIQLGDRPLQDDRMGNFSRFNEPYYLDYVNCDLGAMFEDAGLVPHMKTMASATKALSFIKPMDP